MRTMARLRTVQPGRELRGVIEIFASHAICSIKNVSSEIKKHAKKKDVAACTVICPPKPCGDLRV